MSPPSSNRDLATILDILEAAEFIAQCLMGITFEQFVANLEKQFAVEHQLMIIGEAVKRLSDGFRDQYPKIPWHEMAGMRDILIHRYDDVDLALVWRSATNRLPTIVPILRGILPPPQS
jgi:uncharacterized protein with HEPN domain